MLVIDANIALALVIPVSYSNQASERFAAWAESLTVLAAPALFGFEVTSGLHKAVSLGVLTQERANSALESIFSLGIQELAATPELHRAALSWADRLGQTVAYDAYSIAAAESVAASFWTADRGLYDSARAADADWVHLIDES
jgi:predicted nucleic acid-binding protein